MTAIIELYQNNAASTLANAITAGSTTIYLYAGTGSRFPNPVVGKQFFRLVLTGALSPNTLQEVVYVTARSGDVLTVTRAQEGTTARSWGAADLCYSAATSGTLSQFLQSNYGADTGVADAYVVSTPQNVSAYYTGMPVVFTTANANTTTTPTLNVNGVGAATIKCVNGVAVQAGDIAANEVMYCIYNGSDSSWRLQTLTLGNINAVVSGQFVVSVNGKTGVVSLTVGDIPGAAPLLSPAFTGSPTSTTAPKFDSTTRIATTEFVQNALGSLYATRLVTSATTLTAADCGKEIICNSGTYTVTLPSSTAVVDGAQISFISPSATVTLSRQGTDVVYVGFGSTTITSVTMNPGDTLTLDYSSALGAWIMVGGSVQQRYNNQFPASLNSNGYQKLPSGWIIQWGYQTTGTPQGAFIVAFPISFPHAFFNAHATSYAAGLAGIIPAAGIQSLAAPPQNPPTVSGMWVDFDSATNGFYWNAIGY